jgi:hypothetical protein
VKRSQQLAESVVRSVARLGWGAPALYLVAIVVAFGVYAVRRDPARPPVDNSIKIWFLEDDQPHLD